MPDVKKQDSFFTRYDTIEKEIPYYIKQLNNKTIYCNCDNPLTSNFVKYFTNNFRALNLKKLIATYYIDAFTRGYALIKTPTEESLLRLNSNGDFRQKECVDYLEEADYVITNPPFSLLNPYVGQLIKHDKKFLILAHLNMIIRKHTYPLFKNNKVWLGQSIRKGGVSFTVPNDYQTTTNIHGVDPDTNLRIANVACVRWFTNMYPDNQTHTPTLTLTQSYHPDKYPRYDNYNAIEVPRLSLIPKDYMGVMGVPITFFDKHNPDQFTIIAIGRDVAGDELLVNNKYVYARVLIKRNTT
jgi:hypothetical protein